MSQYSRKGNTHNNQKASAESTEINDGIAWALDEIIGVGASSADPVGKRGEDVGCDDEEGQVLVEAGAGEDYEEETDC